MKLANPVVLICFAFLGPLVIPTSLSALEADALIVVGAQGEEAYSADFDEAAFSKEINDMFTRFMHDSREMESKRAPKIVNTENWGWGSSEFAETVI